MVHGILVSCSLGGGPPAPAAGVLRGGGQEADRARGLAAGANDYLTKPFSPLALFTLVRSLLPEATLWPQT